MITAYIDRNRVATQTGLISIDGSKFQKGYAVLGSPDLIKELMNVIHEHYNVNFIYDSSLDLNIEPQNRINPSRQSLEECLTALFEGTGIEWEVMKKYIVLTHTDKKKEAEGLYYIH